MHLRVGVCVGVPVGKEVGIPVGDFVGFSVGLMEGVVVGSAVLRRQILHVYKQNFAENVLKKRDVSQRWLEQVHTRAFFRIQGLLTGCTTQRGTQSCLIQHRIDILRRIHLLRPLIYLHLCKRAVLWALR